MRGDSSVLDEHAGLTPAAVAGYALVGGNLAYGMTASRAGQPAFVMHLQEVPGLGMNAGSHPLPHRENRILDYLPRAVKQAEQLLWL